MKAACTSLVTLLVIVPLMSRALLGATPSADQALKLTPVQEGVDYDRPKPDEVDRCKISARKIDGHVGWIVESPDGVLLRKFVDSNGDNVVDQWSYYKDGVEVYRDVDSKYSGKADQYRWFHNGGTRWGIDSTGNGKIDTWRSISAEEVTAEIVAALANRDVDRFNLVLLTPEELQSLGLGRAKADLVAAKIAKATADFRSLAARQKMVTPETKWLQFGGSKPGVVPADTDGSAKDFQAYENVVAIVQSGEKHGQVQIGTLVRIGNVWKVIDAPVIAGEGQPEVASGFFFQASPAARNVASGGSGSDETQKIITELEKLEPGDLHRADLIQQVADSAKTPEDRAMWYRQLADIIGAAVQSGKCPDGDKRLQALLDKLQKNEADKNLAAYVKIRQLTAAYGLSLQAKTPDVAKIQTEWLKNLEQYIADYPATPDAAEAMLQLGIAREYAGQEDDAKKWYGRIVSEFADSSQAKKAAGATTRLDSVGKSIMLSGKTATGGTVDLADYRGKVVLIQYWATWCAPAKNDMPTLKRLVTKYGPGFTILGVSLDTNPKDLSAYLAENQLPWTQIFEEGGPDSPPANVLGIITVPTMILVDQQGQVVNRNIQTSEIEAELKRLVK